MRTAAGLSSATAAPGEGTARLGRIEVPEPDDIRVLVVDDQRPVRMVLRQILKGEGYPVEEADSVSAARTELSKSPFQVVLLDMAMPGENGLVLLEEVAGSAPELITIVVSATDDVELAVAAMKQGAYDYLTKPFTTDTVLVALRRAMERRRLEIENRDYRLHLEALVRDRTRKLRELAVRLADTQAAIVWVACSLAESRDATTGAHLDRMAMYCRLLALSLPERVKREHGVSEQYAEHLYQSAPLHDIGKVAIPDSILLKPGLLSPCEYEVIKGHPTVGREILQAVRDRVSAESAPALDLGIEICLGHHERFDGTGYPSRAKGAEIPLGARIAALADVYDATTSSRPYRPIAFTHEQARALIVSECGRAFDPAVVDAFLLAESGIRDVAERLRDDPTAWANHPAARSRDIPGRALTFAEPSAGI